jgi:protein-L-isoaspartate O-methyltransferase
MKTLVQTLSKAERLECELNLLTENVGDILRRPASRRDATQLGEAWLKVEDTFSRIRLLGGPLRKIKKPTRKRLKRLEYRAQHDDYIQARDVIRRLKAWDDMVRIVQRHLDPVRTPLLSQLHVTEPDPLLTTIYRALHLLANPNEQGQQAQDLGCFSDIPLSISHFDMMMSAAYRVGLAQNPRRAMRFLDVGCGGGTKVLSALCYFRQADGLEYDEKYVESARRTLQLTGAENSAIIHADAMTFESYSDYDVIYLYRPLRTDALLEKLEQQIMRQARPGTILVMPYRFAAARAGIDCARIVDPVFVTGIGQAEADNLREDSEATGTDILNRSSDQDFDAGYWAPILDAASFSSAG